ncbi:ricin B-like lectin [Irpex lacteus]|nr:ricin B-like lectin [Irpex lacteus]
MASEKLADGVYFIQNIGTGTVLTLHGGSAEDGTLAEGTAKRELSDPWVSAQLWIITKVIVDDGRTYSVQNGNSRTYLTLKDGSTVGTGTPIIGYEHTGSGDQHWMIVRNAKKTAYVITNETSRTAVDLWGGGNADGTAVNGYYANNDNNNQLWQLVRI